MITFLLVFVSDSRGVTIGCYEAEFWPPEKQ